MKISTEVFDRYMEASVELFMECYARTITVNTDDDLPEDCSSQLQDKCKALIKATHRRQKLIGFLKGTKRVLKSVAVLAIAFLSLSSVLFMTVEAVREPVLDFYIKQKDGHIEISSDRYALDYTPSYQNAPIVAFNEQDPLGFLLPEDFCCDSIVGAVDEQMYSATYFDTNRENYIDFSISVPESYYSIDTDDCVVTEFEISGNMAVMSEDLVYNSVVLMWYNAHLDKLLSLTATSFTGKELILMAEALNDALYQTY